MPVSETTGVDDASQYRTVGVFEHPPKVI